MRNSYSKSQIWDYYENSPGSQHVYGLTVAPDGSVLAFTEARIKSGDDDPHHLVLKRGIPEADGSMTWGENIFIERGDSEVCWANPAALTDMVINRVLFFYVMNLGGKEQHSTRVFFRYSDDNGITWSEASEVSDLFADSEYGWTFHMSGPGHGIQLCRQFDKHLNGRLLLQFWHRRPLNTSPRNYGMSLIYSDDHGKSWHRGATVSPKAQITESRIAELSDGCIYVSGRGVDETANQRISIQSRDGGITLSTPKACSGFKLCWCDAGMINLKHADRELLLLSHPAELDDRVHLTVSTSTDGGVNWKNVRTIDEGMCQYSDMVLLPDNSIGLLWGSGKYFRQRTLFARFTPEWLFKAKSHKFKQSLKHNRKSCKMQGFA